MGPRRRIQLYILFLVSAVHTAIAASTANLRAKALFPVGPDASTLEVPDCTCGCCHVTYRTPDEVAQGGTVFLKCALDEVQSEGKAISSSADLNGKVSTQALSCQESCSPTLAKDAQPDATQAANDETGGESNASPIDYNRYCFYNCRPYDFTVGNICVSLTSEQKKVLKGEVDPAVHPQVSDPALQDAWAVSTGAKPPPEEADATVTTTLPCAQADPCAYGMMEKSISDAKAASKTAEAYAKDVAKIAENAASI